MTRNAQNYIYEALVIRTPYTKRAEFILLGESNIFDFLTEAGEQQSGEQPQNQPNQPQGEPNQPAGNNPQGGQPQGNPQGKQPQNAQASNNPLAGIDQEGFFSTLWKSATAMFRVEDSKQIDTAAEALKQCGQKAEKFVDKVKCYVGWFLATINKFGRKLIQWVKTLIQKLGGLLPEKVRNWVAKFFRDEQGKPKKIWGMNKEDLIIGGAILVVIAGTLGQLIRFIRNRLAQKGQQAEAYTAEQFLREHEKRILVLQEADTPKTKSSLLDKLTGALVKLIDFAKSIGDAVITKIAEGIALVLGVILFILMLVALEGPMCKAICYFRILRNKGNNFAGIKSLGSLAAKGKYILGKTLYAILAALGKVFKVDNAKEAVLGCIFADKNDVSEVCATYGVKEADVLKDIQQQSTQQNNPQKGNQ